MGTYFKKKDPNFRRKKYVPNFILYYIAVDAHFVFYLHLWYFSFSCHFLLCLCSILVFSLYLSSDYCAAVQWNLSSDLFFFFV